ncbi:MAG: hypothetical protein ABFC96_08010, partial [Thermoguttaceae bacterium]
MNDQQGPEQPRTARKRRIVWRIALGIVALLVLALVGLYIASRHEPAFYHRALAIDAADLAKGSNRMVRKLAALQSVGQRDGRWDARITDLEVNGWLAVDLAKNHSKTLPAEMHDPRVAIDPSGITAACRFQHGIIDTVLSLKVQPFLSSPDVVGLRIVRARAGAIPLPLRRVLDGVTEAARTAGVPLGWQHADGDPVALFAVPDDADRVVRIDTIELRHGEIYISGATR